VDVSTRGDGEIFEATVFLHHFNDLTDTRQQAKVVYPLDEVLLLALLATLAGAETFTDIARFGEKKLALLRRFRPFKDGTPPHDQTGANGPRRIPRRQTPLRLAGPQGRHVDRGA
jgi:hypothetical protein